MAIRIEDIQKASECHSISRAGRMTEAFSVRAHVSLTKEPKKSVAKGFGQLLLDDDVGNMGRNKGGSDARETELCSSARVHPETQLRLEQSEEAAKVAGFHEAGSSYMRVGVDPVAVITEAPKLDATITSPLRVRPTPLASSSFLSPSKSRALAEASGNPPVGHYNPRYKIVESSTVALSFPTAPKEPPPKVEDIPVDSPVKAAPKSTKTPSKAGTPTPKLQPSACFCSPTRDIAQKTPKRKPNANDVPEPIIMNYDAVHAAAHRGFSFEKTVGRIDTGAKLTMSDRTGAFVPSVHVPGVSFGRSSQRSLFKAIPQEGMQLPLDPSKFESVKYARTPSPTFSFPVSEKRSPTVFEPTPTLSMSPMRSPHHLQSVDISKLPARRADVASPVLSLSYDTAEAETFLRQRSPTARIAPLRSSHPRVEPEPEPDYPANTGGIDKSVRRKLAQDVSLSKSLTRDAAAKAGRIPQREIHTTETELLPLRNEFGIDAKGDPMIRSRVSRDQREKCLRAVNSSPDTVYDVKYDSTAPQVGPGYVAFGKMVSREKHKGSYFTGP